MSSYGYSGDYSAKKFLDFYPVKKIIGLLGITYDPLEEPDRFLQALENITNCPESIWGYVFDAARAIGMHRGSWHLQGTHKAVIVLAGRGRETEDRTLLAAEDLVNGFMWDRQHIKPRSRILAIAGRRRTLTSDEKVEARNFIAKTEADLVESAKNEVSDLGLEIRSIISEEDLKDSELIRFALKNLRLREGGSVAVVASSLDWIAIHFDLKRVASEHGISSTYVSSTASNIDIRGKDAVPKYFSAIKRAIRAAVLATKAEVSFERIYNYPR